ncbi:MAG: DUF2314 domain-containing protein [Caldilineaceae bacterium]
MWLIDISYQDGKFTGKIGNEPVYRKDLKLGDEVTVPISSITDWMIIEDGKLIGGYTIRVLRNRMSETEREAFDKDLDFIIEN